LKKAEHSNHQNSESCHLKHMQLPQQIAATATLFVFFFRAEKNRSNRGST
jgi:hypothetical protein